MNEVMIQMVEKPNVISEKSVTSLEEAIDVCLTQISNLSQEAAIVINFNEDFIPLNFCLVGLGTPKGAPCRPADFYKSAILSNARYTIAAHNHPYPSSLAPSRADITLCKDLVISGYHLGITLMDFLICQGETYMSFKDSCPEFLDIEKLLNESSPESK